jgi:hypothetical protein
VFPAGMFDVTDQSPGLAACNVCCQPLIGAQTLLPTLVFEVVEVIRESPYGPHSPFAALVEHTGPDDATGADVAGAGGGADEVRAGSGLAVGDASR